MRYLPVHTYMLVPCILVQSCAHLLSALLRTLTATVTAQINNKVSDKKRQNSAVRLVTYVSTVRLASIKIFICPKLNIAIADIHVSKSDI